MLLLFLFVTMSLTISRYLCNLLASQLHYLCLKYCMQLYLNIEDISDKSNCSFNPVMTCTSPMFIGPSASQLTHFPDDLSYSVAMATQNQTSLQLSPSQIIPLSQPCNNLSEVFTLILSLCPVNSNMDVISTTSFHTTTTSNTLAGNTIDLSLNTATFPNQKENTRDDKA